MRVGVEEKVKDIYSILQILNSHVNEEVKIEDVLVQMLENGITSSDMFFIVLKKLRLCGYLYGERGNVKIFNKIPDEEMEKISKNIDYEIGRNENLFVTPLEIAKFYMCPRRLFLEKIAMSKQFKEGFGKTWDGEAIHLAINLFVRNFGKGGLETILSEVSEQVIDKYKDKMTLTRDQIKDFITSFYEMIQEEKFNKIFTEKCFESFEIGLVGTPDLICIKENGEIVPIDIKLGKIGSSGIKEEHILQIIGEAMLAEEFFRRKVDYSYLIYFGSNSIEKIELNEFERRKIISYKKMIERFCKSSYIPEKTTIKNSDRRICAGCHVKPACKNIEDLRRIYY